MPESTVRTMEEDPASAPTAAPFDPVYLHSLRETWVVAGAWLVALLWSVPYCYLTGYSIDAGPDGPSLTMGIPTWAFWGIAVPWLAADAFTVWFCFFYMADDDLGIAADEHPAPQAEERQ